MRHISKYLWLVVFFVCSMVACNGQPTASFSRLYFKDSLNPFPGWYSKFYFVNYKPKILWVRGDGSTSVYRNIVLAPSTGINSSLVYYNGTDVANSYVYAAGTGVINIDGNTLFASGDREIKITSTSVNANLKLTSKGGASFVESTTAFKADNGIYNDAYAPNNALTRSQSITTWDGAAGAFVWNMQTTGSISFAHNLGSVQITQINVTVCNNTGSNCYDFENANGTLSGYWSYDGTNITLTRPAGSFFNSASFSSPNHIFVTANYLTN